MNLSPHFSLAELIRSTKAEQLGIDNRPPPGVLNALGSTAAMLELIRDELGVPMTIASGYRCPELNKAIGSQSTSQHILGHAADFVAPKFGTPAEIVVRLSAHMDDLGIGQLILEGSKRGREERVEWVHVSTIPPLNPINRLLTITDAGTVAGIHTKGFA